MSELFHFLKILNNLSMNWEKYDFHWEEWNFQPIANSAHTIGFLALGNENMKCKHFKYKFVFNKFI